MIFLRKDSKSSLNIRAAYLHMLGDTLSSVAVIAGATLIRYTGILWIDPLLTVVISVVIIVQAYGILRESTDILMQATPQGVDLNRIKSVLEENPRIRNVHHVHCWQMLDHEIHYEAHIDAAGDMLVSESSLLVGGVEKLLMEEFGIHHVTLQVESGCCRDQEMIRKAHPSPAPPLQQGK